MSRFICFTDAAHYHTLFGDRFLSACLFFVILCSFFSLVMGCLPRISLTDLSFRFMDLLHYYAAFESRLFHVCESQFYVPVFLFVLCVCV